MMRTADAWEGLPDTCYNILDLPTSATGEQVRTAWRAAARVHHPDAGGEVSAFEKAKQSYDVLSNPVVRARYDMFLERTAEKTATPPPNPTGTKPKRGPAQQAPAQPDKPTKGAHSKQRGAYTTVHPATDEPIWLRLRDNTRLGRILVALLVSWLPILAVTWLWRLGGGLADAQWNNLSPIDHVATPNLLVGLVVASLAGVGAGIRWPGPITLLSIVGATVGLLGLSLLGFALTEQSQVASWVWAGAAAGILLGGANLVTDLWAVRRDQRAAQLDR